MSNILSRLHKKKQIVESVKVEVPKTKAYDRVIISVINYLKNTNVTNEVPRERFDRDLGCSFTKEELDAGLNYLSRKNIAWGDEKKVACQGSLWGCSECESFFAGDGWHSQRSCKGGRSMMIIRSDEGKRCSGFRPKSLSAEFQSGWVES